MANKDNLLTVKEYAELKKVSVQYVYKLLNNDSTNGLKKFKVVEDKVYISKDALNQDIDSTNVKPNLNQNFKLSLNKVESQNNGNFAEDVIKEKERLIEQLYKDIEEKNKLIENLQNHETELTELLRQAQQLNYNNQVLLKEKNEPRGFFKRLFGKKDAAIKND